MPHSYFNIHTHHTKLKSKRKKSLLDQGMFIVAIGSSLTTLPQVDDVLINRKVQGVSLFTWSAYAVLSLIWLFYGIKRKEKPVIISSLSGLVLDSLIVIGVLLFH